MLDRYANDLRALAPGDGQGQGGEPTPPTEQDILDAPDIDEGRSRWLTAFRDAPPEERAGVLHEFWTWWSAEQGARRTPSDAEGSPSGPNLGRIWQAALAALQAQVSRQEFDTWVRGTCLVALDGSVATVAAPSPVHREAVEQQLLRFIRRALGDVLGAPVQVRVEVRAGA